MSGVYMAMLAKDTPSPLIAKDPAVKVEADAPKAEAPKEAPGKARQSRPPRRRPLQPSRRSIRTASWTAS